MHYRQRTGESKMSAAGSSPSATTDLLTTNAIRHENEIPPTPTKPFTTTKTLKTNKNPNHRTENLLILIIFNPNLFSTQC